MSSRHTARRRAVVLRLSYHEFATVLDQLLRWAFRSDITRGRSPGRLEVFREGLEWVSLGRNRDCPTTSAYRSPN